MISTRRSLLPTTTAIVAIALLSACAGMAPTPMARYSQNASA